MDKIFMINWRDPHGGEAYRVKVWRKNEIEAAEWFALRYPFVKSYTVEEVRGEKVQRKHKKRCRAHAVKMAALTAWAVSATVAAVLLFIF